MFRSHRRIAPVSALVLAVGLLAGSLRAAQIDLPYGLNVHAPAGSDLPTLMNAAHDGGFGWVRVDFVWAFIEPAQGQYDFAAYDAIVDAAAARGLGVLAILAYSPRWATDGPELSGVPRDPADWQDFCSRVAERYRGKVERFELWNEPNQNAFWDGSRNDYIDIILKPGADAIHAANAAAKVGGPALAHVVAGDSDWYRWLYDVLRSAASSLDFVTHHLYDQDGESDVTKKLTGSTRFANTPSLWDVENPSLREVLKKVGWYPSRPVWLTETGWDSAAIGEPTQAAHLGGFLDAWFTGRSGQSWLEKVFIYEARDGGNAAFGLLRADDSRKPSFDTVRAFVAGHGGLPPDDSELRLFGQRFTVSAHWRTSDGVTGSAHALPLTDQSGELWFFDANNVELVVKLLDGRPLNQRFWFFYGALSNVEYWITVTDTVTGATKEYHNPQGRICGQADTEAFTPQASALTAEAADSIPASARTAALAGCVSDGSTLCLQGGRFRARVNFRDHSGHRGGGHPIPANDQFGRFWFFDSANVELEVKLLDGRGTNGRWWVLWGALSNVEYDLIVTDMTNGKTRTYHNASGSYCGGADIRAF